MTYLRRLSKRLVLSAVALTLGVALPSASAMATDATTGFQVSSTTDSKVRLGVKAFQKGEFQRSIRFNQRALDSKLSSKKAAIAYSNICAAFGKLGKRVEAQTACDAALALRPTYKPALANQAAVSSLHLLEN